MQRWYFELNASSHLESSDVTRATTSAGFVVSPSPGQRPRASGRDLALVWYRILSQEKVLDPD